MKKTMLIQLVLFFLVSSNLQARKIAIHNLSDTISTAKSKQIEKLQYDMVLDDEDRPMTSTYRDTPDGNFRIHYLTSGKNAVPMSDKNNNDIPDYIDSAMYYAVKCYSFYVDTVNYVPFAFDDGLGGSNAYDMYFWDQGNYDEQDSGGNYGFNTPYRVNGLGPLYSYTVIDNDFSPDDIAMDLGEQYRAFHTFGYDGLKITIAHEMHHACQNRYGIPRHHAGTIMEMSSVFYEWRMFPEIKDYYQYANYLLTYANQTPFSQSHRFGDYSYSLFLIYAYQKYNNDDVFIRRIWENIRAGRNAFYALNDVFIEYGSSLDDAWDEFMDWLYYTGKRAIPGKYFDDAADWVGLEFYKKMDYEYPLISEETEINSYECRAYRINFPIVYGFMPDTLDFIITSHNLTVAAKDAPFYTPINWLLSENASQNSEYIDTLEKYYYSLQTNSEEVIYHLYPHKGTKPIWIENAYPSPFNPNRHLEIFFPITSKAKYLEKAELFVFTADMTPVYAEKKEVIFNNSNVCLSWIPPSSLANGIYIFQVKHKQGTTIGKFAVRR